MMENQLFKLNRHNHFLALNYIDKLTKLSIMNIDFTEFIGRDLTEQEKKEYFLAYERKGTLEIIQIIFNDYFEGRL